MLAAPTQTQNEAHIFVYKHVMEEVREGRENENIHFNEEKKCK